MKQVAILITIILMINLTNGMANTFTPAVALTPHVIKNAVAHGKKPKLKLKSTLALAPAEPQESIVIDDDVIFGRNRNRIEIIREHEEKLSDYVRWRLFLARQLALMKYKEKWA
jgi:hypothetical protein